nr:SurA N-terminal domain-containing protein [Deltaproteobacteria bacterium]
MVSGEVKMSSLTRFIWASVFIFGCVASEPDVPNEYLIRVGNRVMTVADFNRTFELAKAAYPHNVLQNEAVLKIIRSRLLSQITEEMILMQRAAEIQVSVTDEELEKAISDIKRDYPDGVFKQTLLECAVP